VLLRELIRNGKFEIKNLNFEPMKFILTLVWQTIVFDDANNIFSY